MTQNGWAVRVGRAVAGLGLVVLAACGGGGSRPGAAGGVVPNGSRSTSTIPVPIDAVQVYRAMGLFAEGQPVPYVGSLSFLAGPAPDSTIALLTVSIASRSLEFTREGDTYRAGYRIAMEMRRDSVVVRRFTANETVRVNAFKETTRGDESVIFQQALFVPPGRYTVALTVSGMDISKTGAPTLAEVVVPRLGSTGLSSPIAYYEAEPRTTTAALPKIIATPRSTVVFGRDSTLPVYLEAYSSVPRLALGVGVLGEQKTTLWTDSAVVLNHAQGSPTLLNGTVNVPVARLGIGVTTLSVWRYDSPDTVKVPIFITFGDELPVATLEQMLSYLRFYANAARLKSLRDTTPEARAKLWARFLKDTDPNPDTPEHEGLRDYFQRIQVANARFRDEGGSGWLTDRGMVYVTLGEPDQVLEPTGVAMAGERGRVQVWEYRNLRLQLQFVDQNGFGRWRLTNGSLSDFNLAARRAQVGG